MTFAPVAADALYDVCGPAAEPLADRLCVPTEALALPLANSTKYSLVNVKVPARVREALSLSPKAPSVSEIDKPVEPVVFRKLNEASMPSRVFRSINVNDKPVMAAED